MTIQHTDEKLNTVDESPTEIQTFNEWVEKVQQRWLRKRVQRNLKTPKEVTVLQMKEKSTVLKAAL